MSNFLSLATTKIFFEFLIRNLLQVSRVMNKHNESPYLLIHLGYLIIILWFIVLLDMILKCI